MSAPEGARWSGAERSADLDRAERDGVELLIIGGGITGAGILRDAATRGLRAFLVERSDFASGTSSRSSKLVHGGLRYLAEGQPRVTLEACRERDALLRLAPHLVQPLPFLFPAYEDSKVPLWQVRAALSVYALLGGLRRSSRFRMLGRDEVARYARDLRTEGLRGAGLYHDAQVDDARLVLETLRSARSLGCPAANHAEVVELLRGAGGRLCGARVRDRVANRVRTIRADVVVNAAGPSVERVRGLDHPIERPELRPAKGVHLVIPRARIRTGGAVTFEGPDRRHLFLVPWGEVALLGTTDTFSDEIDEPVVTIDEVHYLLHAANAAFPRVGLTTNDLRSVFAGVRPLAASPEQDAPPSSVSREERLSEDPSGLISVAGGKLTTYRATAERVVDRIAGSLSAPRRGALAASGTATRPLREDRSDSRELADRLSRRFGVAEAQAAHLARSYGDAAEELAGAAQPGWLRPIGGSRYSFAEIAWSLANECPAGLCDLLERRLRVALFAEGQGLPELEEIAAVAARAADWDAERTRCEMRDYAEAVRRRYQIVASSRERSAA